jgi:membrane protease YdiL (CAAX protease family)
VTNALLYHRLDCGDSRYRWWRPLLIAPLAVLFYFVFLYVFLAGVGALAQGTLNAADYALYTTQISTANSVRTHPLALAVLLGSVIVMFPALILARFAVGAPGMGRLSSVVGRLRWRWLAVSVLPAAGYVIAQVLVGYVVQPAVTGEGLGAPTTDIHQFILFLVVLVVLVPFQASAEEYVFRGFILQSVGGWVRWPVIAIACSAVPFVFGHLYNWWGLGEILVFALVAAWLTIRTGGLEAAIVVHTLSNLSALGIPGLGFEHYTEADGSPASLVAAAVLLPLYALAVDRLFARSRLSNVAPASPSSPLSSAA